MPRCQTIVTCRGCLNDFKTEDLRDSCCSPRCRDDVARAEKEARELAAERAPSAGRTYRYDWQRFGDVVNVDKPIPAGLHVVRWTDPDDANRFCFWLVQEDVAIVDEQTETFGEAFEPIDAPVLVLRIGDLVAIKVHSLEEASARYQELRDASGQGSSEWPVGFVGAVSISYNGRVWLGRTLVLEAACYAEGSRS